MRTLGELAQGLNKIYPTRYSHFTKKQEPPFICYLDDGANTLVGDGKVIEEGTAIQIELYSKTKDLAAERKIKQFLNDNELPYEKGPTIWIESEGLFLCTFSIEITE